MPILEKVEDVADTVRVTNRVKVVVPKGTTIYEGIAMPQNIYDSIGNVAQLCASEAAYRGIRNIFTFKARIR